jgi:hypothetical protein
VEKKEILKDKTNEASKKRDLIWRGERRMHR